MSLSPRLLLVLAMANAPLAAQDFLPPPQAAQAAIATHAEVRAADARVSEARERARALAAGPHDTTLGIAPVRRSVRDAATPSGRASQAEWELQLSRAIRLPGKTALDRESGAHGLAAAALLRGDAEHQAARRLLALWLGWLRAEAVAHFASARHDSLVRERDVIQRRLDLGAAAQRELDQIEAELAGAVGALRQAQGDAAAQRLALGTDFSLLALPARAPQLPAPVALDAGASSWVERIIERSHEIRASEELAAQRESLAARAHRDRLPDPSIGLRSFSERDGMERGIGIVLNIPFGGSRRSAEARAEDAAAEAARDEVDAMRRDITREAQLDVARSQLALELWQAALAAQTAHATSAARQRRAWELGEIGLAERLQAERLAADAALAELRARADAHETRLRVLIDAHELWHLADDTADHASHALP